MLGRLSKVDVFQYRSSHDSVLVGTLVASFGAGRSLEGASFRYADGYLEDTNSYPISPDLPLAPGVIYTPVDNKLFGIFHDCSPDLWGQRLIDHLHEIRVAQGIEEPGKLGLFDYLIGVSDETRMGALRLRAQDSEEWLTIQQLNVLSANDLPQLLDAKARYEDNIATDDDLSLLGMVATSPGGARPKANLISKTGRLAIAKLPHSKDGLVDVEAWEAVALQIAHNIGIRTPRFRLHQIHDEHSVLILERFDRDDDGNRLPYMSAATAMQVSQYGAEAETYVDLADTMSEMVHSPQRDLPELFDRIALTIMVNNVDDHWRNHGFLRTSRGWELSPVFDVNPSRERGSVYSRPVSDSSNRRKRSLGDLIEVAPSFLLSKGQAAERIAEIAENVYHWQKIATDFGIAEQQQEHMAPAFTLPVSRP